MSNLLDDVIAEVKKLSQERQNEAAELLMSFVGHHCSAVQLSPEQIEEIESRIECPTGTAEHADVSAFFLQSCE